MAKVGLGLGLGGGWESGGSKGARCQRPRRGRGADPGGGSAKGPSWAPCDAPRRGLAVWGPFDRAGSPGRAQGAFSAGFARRAPGHPNLKKDAQ